jgi:hypothetical protein
MSRSRLTLAREASRAQLKARVAIDGPTGSGKTWTALEWAFILAGDTGKVLVIDTERGSAEWYSDQFPAYKVVVWAPPYDPGELAATLADAGPVYDVIVADSLSHFWEGEGGTRDIVDAASQRFGGNSFAGWKVGTPALRHLVDTLLGVDAHVIATMRSKMEYVLEEDERGNKRPKKVGLAPVMRQGVEYEFTLIADMDLEHRFSVTKSRCSDVADLVAQPHRAGEIAQKFREWLDAGERPIPEADAQRLAAVLNGAGSTARAGWLDRFGVKPHALPESRLAEAQAYVDGLDVPEDDPPPGNGADTSTRPGESSDRETEGGGAVATAETSPGPSTDPATGEGAGASPGAEAPRTPPPERLGKVDLVKAAGRVFRDAAQAAGEAAEKGHKTKTRDLALDRLRHALTHVITAGGATSTKDLNGDQSVALWYAIDDVAAGRITFEADLADPAAGVTFTRQPSGTKATVLWSELDPQGEAA